MANFLPNLSGHLLTLIIDAANESLHHKRLSEHHPFKFWHVQLILHRHTSKLGLPPMPRKQWTPGFWTLIILWVSHSVHLSERPWWHAFFPRVGYWMVPALVDPSFQSVNMAMIGLLKLRLWHVQLILHRHTSKLGLPSMPRKQWTPGFWTLIEMFSSF